MQETSVSQAALAVSVFQMEKLNPIYPSLLFPQGPSKLPLRGEQAYLSWSASIEIIAIIGHFNIPYYIPQTYHSGYRSLGYHRWVPKKKQNGCLSSAAPYRRHVMTYTSTSFTYVIFHLLHEGFSFFLFFK